MDDKSIELIYALQIQQIDLNKKLMDKWSEVGDLIAEMLEIHRKVLGILNEEAKEEPSN